MKIKYIAISVLMGLTLSAQGEPEQNSLIPGNTGGLYYQLGGGDVTPLPYAPDSDDIDLGVSGTAGLGYNCGQFNPMASIVNGLDGLKGSFEHMEAHVMSNAEGALLELPAWKLSQTFPTLYRLLQDGISNGQFDVGISEKNCQQMSSEISQGKDPYNDWLQASLGDNWKYHMNMSGSQNSNLLGASVPDIHQASQEVNADNGKSGVQWTHGNNLPNKGDALYAGGQGQPVIHLIGDTVLAGYNALVDKTRLPWDKSTPAPTPANKNLLNAFPSPADAAKWIVNVVGEQEITTYPGGDKTSTPGVGLLSDVQISAADIKKKLVALVTNVNSDLSIKKLQEVSPPRVMINNATIQMLRNQTDGVMQAIYIDKLADEVAVARVIDKAKLALNIMQVGEQVPPINANHAAQNGIALSIKHLKSWIAELRENPKDNQEFVGNTVAALINDEKSKQIATSMTRPSANKAEPMVDGALKTTN